MVDTSNGVDDSTIDELNDSEEFDSLAGIIGDGVVGAAGGLVGTAIMTVGLLTELVGLESVVPLILFGFLVFLGGGMFPWPLLYASLKAYLPGQRDPVSGAFFGFAIWTGFVMGFYTGQSGLALAGYAVLTLLAHVVYGVGLGLVFESFQTRPDSIV